ncbi:hypothetical protein NO995_00740 [Aestuariibaculum sp. M13]|uniref:hypothetical protein n=1 Tax=Aestuariibaculum sp. M13 TaxID=2967132 RepID=UPI002159F6B0|nr:hypothetical protein [Aestuariibaculum sp. M13]MCR8666197.1 hypothetical protein [Aestuariibaculum sp. M13]
MKLKSILTSLLFIISSYTFSQNSTTIEVFRIGRTLVDGESVFDVNDFINVRTKGQSCFKFLDVLVEIKASNTKDKKYTYRVTITNNSDFNVAFSRYFLGSSIGGKTAIGAGSSEKREIEYASQDLSILIESVAIVFSSEIQAKYPFWSEYMDVNCNDNLSSIIAEMDKRKAKEDEINGIKDKIRSLGEKNQADMEERLVLFKELKRLDTKGNYDDYIRDTEDWLSRNLEDKQNENEFNTDGENEILKSEKSEGTDSNNKATIIVEESNSDSSEITQRSNDPQEKENLNSSSKSTNVTNQKPDSPDYANHKAGVALGMATVAGLMIADVSKDEESRFGLGFIAKLAEVYSYGPEIIYMINDNFGMSIYGGLLTDNSVLYEEYDAFELGFGFEFDLARNKNKRIDGIGLELNTFYSEFEGVDKDFNDNYSQYSGSFISLGISARLWFFKIGYSYPISYSYSEELVDAEFDDLGGLYFGAFVIF